MLQIRVFNHYHYFRFCTRGMVFFYISSDNGAYTMGDGILFLYIHHNFSCIMFYICVNRDISLSEKTD